MNEHMHKHIFPSPSLLPLSRLMCTRTSSLVPWQYPLTQLSINEHKHKHETLAKGISTHILKYTWKLNVIDEVAWNKLNCLFLFFFYQNNVSREFRAQISCQWGGLNFTIMWQLTSKFPGTMTDFLFGKLNISIFCTVALWHSPGLLRCTTIIFQLL